MPELPEVETVVRGLRPLLVGRTIDRVAVRSPRLREPLPAALGSRLAGATATAVRRRGKYGLVDTDRGDTLVFHLGMSGTFRQLQGEAGRHDHLLLEAGGCVLAFHDPRRFGSLRLLRTAELADDPKLRALGPEPLSPAFSAASVAGVAHGRRVPVKALLLDQHAVAGIGNIYASEALYLAGIDPRQPAGAIGRERLAALVKAVQDVLGEAIKAGGSTLRDHAQPSGEPGHFQHRFRVYGRAGEPCPACGGPVQRLVQSGRSTFWCPACQH